jgi:hypothetical protein
VSYWLGGRTQTRRKCLLHFQCRLTGGDPVQCGSGGIGALSIPGTPHPLLAPEIGYGWFAQRFDSTHKRSSRR